MSTCETGADWEVIHITRPFTVWPPVSDVIATTKLDVELATLTVIEALLALPSIATARTVSVCAPSATVVVFHVWPSPLNTYGAAFSVQASWPSRRNSTREIVAPDVAAVHGTEPLTVAPFEM